MCADVFRYLRSASLSVIYLASFSHNFTKTFLERFNFFLLRIILLAFEIGLVLRYFLSIDLRLLNGTQMVLILYCDSVKE